MKKLFSAICIALMTGCAAPTAYRNVAELDAFLETNRIDYVKFKKLIDSADQVQLNGYSVTVTNGVLVLESPR